MTSLSLILLCVLATVTHGISFGNSSSLISESWNSINELHDNVITSEKLMIAANWIIAHKQYISSDFVKEIQEMIKPENAAEIEEIMDYANTILDKNTSDFESSDFLEYEKDYPLVYARSKRVFARIFSRFTSLSEEARTFLTKNIVSSETPTTADRFRCIAELKKGFEKLSASAQAEFYKQFPEIMHFFSIPEYQTFIHNLVELSDKPDDVLEEGLDIILMKFIKELLAMNH